MITPPADVAAVRALLAGARSAGRWTRRGDLYPVLILAGCVEARPGGRSPEDIATEAVRELEAREALRVATSPPTPGAPADPAAAG